MSVKAGYVSSVVNVRKLPYMLEVKQFYNCLLDYVPSSSCKNIASNKFLLLDTEKEERKKSWNRLLYCRKKETRQKLGTPLWTSAVSPLKRIRNFPVGYSPLRLPLWFCLPFPCHVTGMPFSLPAAYRCLLWILPGFLLSMINCS